MIMFTFQVQSQLMARCKRRLLYQVKYKFHFICIKEQHIDDRQEYITVSRGLVVVSKELMLLQNTNRTSHNPS